MIKLVDILQTVLEEEKEKRDRCLRIADRKYDTHSAYKSGAVVRCRQGDIWKDLKENNVDDIHKTALTQTEKEALELVDKNWDNFGGEECNNGFCDIFAKNLAKHLPGSKIMSTEDSRSTTFGHAWIEYKGNYFDAETPNGVTSWKELPWMVKFYNKNKGFVIGFAIILVLVIAVAIFYYRKGKKETKNTNPNLLPDGSTGGTTGASNDEIKNLANEMFKDMNGWNILNGWNTSIYSRALLLNDADIIKLYNTFNAYYQSKYDQSLTEFIYSEQFKPSVMVLLEQRLRKLNLA
jgi:hypothetical protein